VRQNDLSCAGARCSFLSLLLISVVCVARSSAASWSVPDVTRRHFSSSGGLSLFFSMDTDENSLWWRRRRCHVVGSAKGGAAIFSSLRLALLDRPCLRSPPGRGQPWSRRSCHICIYTLFTQHTYGLCIVSGFGFWIVCGTWRATCKAEQRIYIYIQNQNPFPWGAVRLLRIDGSNRFLARLFL
jgi:hypothetical protein